MNDATILPQQDYSAFDGDRLLATGSLLDVALAVKRATEDSATGPVLAFDDAGRGIDFDLRGTDEDVAARLALPPRATRKRAIGRPKLGVVSREVTLLPRHWDWLNEQRGGASVTLRRLVDEARRAGGSKEQMRAAHEAAYHFMSAIAGNRPGFEEATRALFADDRAKFEELIAAWPGDIRNHAMQLAFLSREGA